MQVFAVYPSKMRRLLEFYMNVTFRCDSFKQQIKEEFHANDGIFEDFAKEEIKEELFESLKQEI